MKTKKQSFLQGAAILAATVAIVKVMGAIYKIPLGNFLGDEGYGYFNKAYTIFANLLTLSTAGLPVAMSRLIAKSDAEGNTVRTRNIFIQARRLFACLGGVATLAMFFFARQIAEAMGTPAVQYAIQALSPSVLLVCVTSSYRGYSQGLSNMTPTAVSQIIETMSKLIFGLGLAWYFVNAGSALEYSAAGAILGVSIGSLFALLYMVFSVKIVKVSEHGSSDKKGIIGQLLAIGIPVTLGALPLSIVALFDSFMITPRLNAGGWPSVDALFGVFSKVQTLFNIPSSFIVPITVSVIPAIAARLAAKNREGASNVTGTALKLTMLLALPAGVGLSVLCEPIVNVIYPGSHAEGAGLLAILGIASFFTCTTLVTNAVLQAYGYERVPVYTMICGGILKVSGTYFLTPMLGIRGAAVGTIASFALISILNIAVLFFRERMKLHSSTIRVVLASAVMGAVAFFGYNALLRVIPRQLIALAGAIVVAIVVYAVLIVAFRVITKDDLEFLPKGDKLAKVLRIR